jgi:hypothetical protein
MTALPTVHPARRRFLLAGATTLAVALLAPIGAAQAAPASTGTISVASGTTAGGTQLEITIPMLDGNLRAVASAGARAFIGVDGAVYLGDTTQTTRRVSPNGITFASIASQEAVGRTVINGVASDGTAWTVATLVEGTETMTKVAIPGTVAKASAAGYYLTTDGAVYYGTTRVSAPGRTFTTIDSSSLSWKSGSRTIARGVATDGTAWESTNGSAFTQVNVGRSVTQATSSYYFLGTDGAVYYGSKRVSPAGLVFTSITGRMGTRVTEGASDFLSAVASDGTAWGSTNGGQMVKAPVPVPVVQANGAYFFLGTDGAVYYGAKRISPAGVTFTSISGGMMDQYQAAQSTMSAVASDGSAWVSSPGDTMKQLAPASASAPARTVTSVAFGGTAATEIAQNGNVVNVVTPAHDAGTVDVTVTTKDGATFTLPQAFTFQKPNRPLVNVPARITGTGARLSVGAQGPDCIGDGAGGSGYGYGCLAMSLYNPFPLVAQQSYFDVTLTQGPARPEGFVFDGYWRLTDLGSWQIEGCSDEACTTTTVISTAQKFAANSPIMVDSNAQGTAYQTFRFRYLGGGVINPANLPNGIPAGSGIGTSGLTEMYLILT